MKFQWFIFTTFYMLTSTVFIAHAGQFSWGKTCASLNIDQWLSSCASSENPQTCSISTSNLTPTTEAIRNQGFHPHSSEYEIDDNLINIIQKNLNGCSDYDTGHGHFKLNLSAINQNSTELGVIPAGKALIRININSAVDVDLQMYDGSTALIDRYSGLINGSAPQSIDYKGMHITYSGYAGDDTSQGNEYIHISGITPNELTIQLKGHQTGDVSVDYKWGIHQSLGSIKIPNRKVFDDLSGRSSVPGAIGIRELKFLIKDINSPFPSIYFINSDGVPLHFDFAYDVLDWYPDLNPNEAARVFNSSTYFLDERQHLAGSILANDNFVDENSSLNGLYTLQFWPTDPVAAQLIVKGFQLITAHMKVAQNKLAYFPASDTQTNIYQDNINYFNANQVAVIDSESLFANVSYTAMNLAEGYGNLRIIREGDATPSVNDVAIFTFIPNDLAHVAGIITDTPQTPLSHINLKAKQNNTPNAFIQDATTNPAIAPLINQLVHYKVTYDGFMLAAATQAQVDNWLNTVRPSHPQTPLSDLSVTEPERLNTLRHQDWVSFGAKAANVAELAHVLEPGSFPVGYAIPFNMYDTFMRLNRCQEIENDGITLDGKYRKLCDDPDDPAGKNLYTQIRQIMSDQAFINSPDVRNDQLKAFRKEVKKSEVPTQMSQTLESIRYFWDPDGEFTHSIRLRSSTNNEDLNGFNGAGLYESNTHHPDEGDIADSVKKVWASLWTARAFEERRFYRIDHFKTYMGVLAHLSYGDEQVNGVAVTKNIYDRNWEGYYVNAQYGEISVTNPEPIDTVNGPMGAIPDEFLLSRLVSSETDYRWIQQYIRHSNVDRVYGQPVSTQNVLTDEEVIELRVAMQQIQAHFKGIYDGDEDFAMDIEFKITNTDDDSRGHLEIKQARPWID